MKKIWLNIFVIFFLSGFSFAQTTIAADDFENASIFTLAGGAYLTGSSGAPDGVASSAYASLNSYGYSATNTTATLTKSNFNTTGYTSIYCTIRLAAYSIGATTNGIDPADSLAIRISPDGGITWYSTARVNGPAANNAYWHYTTGTANASTAYDGNTTPVSFVPAGSGARTADGYSTVTITGLPAIANLGVQIYMKTNATAERLVIDEFNLIGTISCSPPSEPGTQASASASSNIGCNSALISWTNGNGAGRMMVMQAGSAPSTPADNTAYTANSNFGNGSALGSGFVVYDGAGAAGFITGLSASSVYYWSVFEYNGSGSCINYKPIGSSGNFTTTSCSIPLGVTAIYIDACPGGCVYEGNNEMIWGQTGSYGLKVANNGPVVQYNSTTPPSSTFISTYAQYPSNISALNTAVTSCGSTTFTDPNTQGYIPANSKFLIAHSCMCDPLAYDLSGLCGAGPIYAVFGNNAAWPCNSAGGIFGNATGCSPPTTALRYIEFDFNNWGVNYVPIYDYDICLLTGGGNGDYTLFNPSGGSAIYYGNSGCVVPMIVLPLELIEFAAKELDDKILINWKTANEKNIEKITLQKSYDSFSFFDLYTPQSFSSESEHEYTYADSDQNAQGIYYRLKISESTGQANYSSQLFIDQIKKNETQILFFENVLFVNWNGAEKNKSLLKITDLAGQCVFQKQLSSYNEKISLSELGICPGLYIASLESAQSLVKSSKIIIR